MFIAFYLGIKSSEENNEIVLDILLKTHIDEVL